MAKWGHSFECDPITPTDKIMSFSIHLTHPPQDNFLAILKEKLDPSVSLTFGEAVPDPATYQILVDGRPSEALLKASPTLQSLIIPWAGIPGKTRKHMAHFPHISVHNLHFNALPVAEVTFMLLLTAAKQTIPFDKALRNNDWTPRFGHGDNTVLLAGKTALILGYGAIGKQVAKMCQAFGMHVLATRRQVGEMALDGYTAVYPASDLHTLLPQANALIITLPLTDETKHLIGTAEINLLPEKAILLNVGRGLIVDESALYHALKENRLHSAGLDVWYNYPKGDEDTPHTPPANLPFNALDNVVFSPHRATFTGDSEWLRMQDLARVVNTAVSGQPLPNRMDLTVGY